MLPGIEMLVVYRKGGQWSMIINVCPGEYLGHAMSGSVASDEVFKRNPNHFHPVPLILGFEFLALSGN